MAVGSSNYPTSVDTVVELVEAANNAADTLNGGIDAIVTSLTVNDASEFAATGIVAIDDELMSYTGKSGNTLTGLTRGIEGTTAASHSSGADVRQVITAASHNVQSAAIIALETKLGTGTDIAWSQMSPLTANRLVVTDGAGDVAVSPLTHDATNVVIGNIGGLDFDTTPTATPTAARMVWDDTHGTVNLTLKGGTVGVDIGQTTVARVVNKTVTNTNLLRSNYQVVRIVSAQGQRLAISLAQGNTEPNSTDVIGLVAENIANNQEGFIVVRGLITEIDTTGSLQGETWADGDILYLSPTTAGGLTKVEPQAPDHLIIVGYVVYAHSQHGKIYVAIQTSWETKELHDVKITGTPVAGSLLIRNATTGVWENATLTAGSNITITNADKSITIAATGSGDVVGPSSATDNALARFDTTTGKLIQNSLITLSDAGALSFPDGVRQTFNPNGTNAGINVGAHTSDPSSPTNGDLWYNSTANQLKTRRGATTEVVATIPSNLGDEIPVLNATTGNLSATGEVFWDGSSNALQIGNTSTGALRLVNATGTDSFTLLPPASGGTVALTLPPGIGSSGQALTSDGTGGTSWSTITAGVSSVSGTSPVVSSGGSTPAISLAADYGDTQNPYASKTANHFLAAPNGTAGAPSFRAIAAADVPTLNQNTTGTAGNVTGVVAVVNGGTGQTSYTDGQLLIGNTATGGLSKATLTAGSNISITNGNGSISIASTAAGVTDGDKGDITVSGSGATWTIDNDAVTYAKIQNVTDNRLLGRSAGTNGDVQEITVGTGLTLSSGQLSGGREVLTADRTYYVRTDGSDSNNGLTDSAGGAFLTIQKAVDVAGSIDPSIYDITIRVKPGTYTGFVQMVSMVMIKNLFIKGDVRVLAGMSYVENSGSRVPVWYGTNNLGGYAGVGNVTITRTTTTRLTITASTTNPNFSGDGWAAGDKILVYSGHSANTFTEYTLSAVGATTLDISSGSFPAIADGYMVTFVPNVKVAPTTTPPTGTIGTFSAVNTLQAYIIGFEILPSSATGTFDCVAPQANAEINVHNCLLNLNGSTSSSGINGVNTKIGNYATNSLPYPLTVVNGGWGVVMQGNGFAITRYIRAAKITYNCVGGYDRSYLDVLGSVGIKCGTAFLASRNAYLDARYTISLGHVTDDYDPNPKTINSTAGSADLSYILT